MCDYSLELYRSRPAVHEEQYTLQRFRSGTIGPAVGEAYAIAVGMAPHRKADQDHLFGWPDSESALHPNVKAERDLVDA